MTGKIYLETYGCQMNVYDSDLVRSILEGEGYVFTREMETADAILVNTCTVRESACERVFGRLGVFSRQKRVRGRPLAVGVLGCMAQDLAERLFEFKAVDFIVGPDGYRHLPRMLEEARNGTTRQAEVRQNPAEIYSDLIPLKKSSPTNAFVTIMRGCNNFCSFCVVPYVRGGERSRPRAQVMEEVRRLSEAGYQEITLLGQNVNSYRDGAAGFTELLAAVAEVPGLKRIRFTSPHPKDFPRPLLQLIAGRPNLCKQIHLPLQAGGDRILQMMKRNYQRREYLDLAEEIKKTIPGVHLSTDLIVGFPTETDAEFEDTATAVRQVEFRQAFIFKYSPRPGTYAAQHYPELLSEETVTRRIVQLNEIQKAIGLRLNQAEIGRQPEILVHGRAKRPAGHLTGRTDGNQIVILPNPPKSPGGGLNKEITIGSWVKVKITGASAHTLFGERI